MKVFGVLLVSLFVALNGCSLDNSNAAAADYVKFFKETGSQKIDMTRHSQLKRVLLYQTRGFRICCDPVPVPTDPAHDFLTALYENIPLDSFKRYSYYSSFRGDLFQIKIHHLNSFCKVCDPSAPQFENSEMLIDELNQTEQVSLMKKIISHCHSKPFALAYIGQLMKEINCENLVEELAVESPEMLLSLFEMGYSISFKHLEKILICVKCSTISSELKRKILLPLIRNVIYDDDSCDKLQPFFELAAVNWSDPKFGSTLGEYTGYIPHCPRTVLLMVDYGFILNCNRKNKYVVQLQEAMKIYTAFKLADKDSILSSLTQDARLLLFKTSEFDAISARRIFYCMHKNQLIRVSASAFDTVKELNQKICWHFRLLSDYWGFWHEGKLLSGDAMASEIDEEMLLYHRSTTGVD